MSKDKGTIYYTMSSEKVWEDESRAIKPLARDNNFGKLLPFRVCFKQLL